MGGPGSGRKPNGVPKITSNKIISIKNGKVIPKISKRKAAGRKNGVWTYNIKA